MLCIQMHMRQCLAPAIGQEGVLGKLTHEVSPTHCDSVKATDCLLLMSTWPSRSRANFDAHHVQ